MKIAIGCLIQWYEVDIIEEYLASLAKAIEYTVEFCRSEGVAELEVLPQFTISSSVTIEEPTEDVTVDECTSKIERLLQKYDFYQYKVRSFRSVSSIGEYRHTFNYEASKFADIIVWGESDMLVPRNMFTLIYSLNIQVAERHSKWIATFATCKMWDPSWKMLEHPDFTDHKHSDSKEDWWSVNYDMSYEEMENINEKYSNDIRVRVVDTLKFNGCGLVISSDVIRAGVNVPPAAFFVHEDTAFMKILQQALPDLKQFHFSNILLVHNRKHPAKRKYVANETGQTIGQRRKSNAMYVAAHAASQENVDNLFSISYKFKTWKDIKTQ